MLRITRRDAGDGHTTLAVEGDLVRDAWAPLEAAVREGLAQHRRLTVDLSGVRFVDLETAEALVALRTREVAIAGGRGFVHRLLEEVTR